MGQLILLPKKSLQVFAHLSCYDAEATYFEDNVRSAKRKQLNEKLLQLVQPAYQSMLGHIVTGTFVQFKDAFDHALKGGKGFCVAARDCTVSSMNQFDERCADVIIKQASWDTSGRLRDKLHHDIETYVVAVRTSKLSELQMLYELKLFEALSGPVGAVLDGASNDTWPKIRGLLQRETGTAVAVCSAALAGFEMNEKTKDIIFRLKDYARGVVEAKAKEEASRVVSRMKDRFTTLFSYDSDSMPRVWTENVDIRAITKTSRSSSLELLSVLAAIRLDGVADNIKDTLVLALDSTSLDQLASSTWDQVPASKTLITPVQCKSVWRQFLSETEYAVTQAIAAQAIDAKAKAFAAQAQAAAAQAAVAKAQAVAAQAQARAAEARAAEARAAQKARDRADALLMPVKIIGKVLLVAGMLSGVNVGGGC